jgi:hypothetical protein
MRKMKLDTDSLAVQSFAIAAGEPEARGTVQGLITGSRCTVAPTDYATCYASCEGSCLSGSPCIYC